jgi:16S rRNA (cytosine967-C5)-methyltransferase
VIAGGVSLDAALAEAMPGVSERDRPLLQQFCYGTLREYPRLEGLLKQLLKSPLKRKDADIQALLAVGLHQLLDLRIPDHATLSATVEACRSLGKPWATRLVNGVLRSATRRHEALSQALEPAAQLRHPPWLLERLQQDWPAHWQQIVEANNTPPPMCLRVNRRKIALEDYAEKLRSAGIGAARCALATDGLRLDTPVDVTRLPGFAEGQVSVQDEAAQLAADLLVPPPGARVLDACAAPGGKTCHLLERYEALDVVAMDSASHRLQPLRDNLARLGLGAQVIEGDARLLPEALGVFDAMLVDAPCSGSGVVRRHPDIKVLRRPDDIPRYSDLQAAILRGLWPRLRPGGVLLYATCSVFPGENQATVADFLAATPNAEVQPLEVRWGIDAGPGKQLLPCATGSDGLFYTLLRKRD